MFARGCFALGSILLLINVVGLTIPIRNSDIYHDKDLQFIDDITLTSEDFHAAIEQGFDSKREHIEYLTYTVSKGIAHYWLDQGVDKYNLRIPFYENYILYLASFVAPEYFYKYEFMNYRRALERGVGLCSQTTIVLTEILREKGIESRIVGLDGHILATAAVDDAGQEWWLLDPDYGVIVPYSLDKVEKNPAVIVPFYEEKGHSQEVIAGLMKAYGPEGNSIKKGIGIEGYGLKLYYFEQLSYLAKWLIPVVLMLPVVWLRWFRKETENPSMARDQLPIIDSTTVS